MLQRNNEPFLSDSRGNLSISSAIVGLMLMTTIGAAMDGAQMMGAKQKLQSMTDAAALMAAMPETASAAKRTALAKSSINSHAAEAGGGLDLGAPQIAVRDDTKQVEVSLSAEIPMLFGAVLGKGSRRVSVSSTAEERFGSSNSALSISLVLDLSSSMGDRFDKGSKLASVNAAVSDMFNMINANFGGEAAAATSVSTGVYPYNWGAIDGETVALSPGTNTVSTAMSYLSLSTGSVPGDALEEALEDQLKEAKTVRNRDRFIVYLTDGKVDEDRDDVNSRYLKEGSIYDAAETKKCLNIAKQLLQTDQMLDPGTASNPGQGSLLSAGLGLVGTLTGLGNSTAAQKRKRIRLRNKYFETCEPVQAMRVAEVCEKARKEDISIIAINLSGEDGVAVNTTELCASGLQTQAETSTNTSKNRGKGTTAQNSRSLPSGLTVNVSADGKSFSGSPENLEDLREMLNSVLPDGEVTRTVRLIN